MRTPYRALLLPFLLSSCTDDPAPPPDLEAETAFGVVTGVDEGAAVVFRGVPYAEPPVGDGRFRAPRPYEGTYAPGWVADTDGAMCMQNADGIGRPGAVVSEDCLFLDVFTPSADDVKRPVMVFVHGGSFRFGSGAEPVYDGSNLADRGNVVVVTLNYRLGVFGFLDVSALPGSDRPESANVGLLDQREALRWVRANIAAFGGDPDNVTVFGESAGSMSVHALLGLDDAPALFDRAILQSGTSASLHDTTYSEDQGLDLLSFADVPDLAGLVALTEDELLAAQKAYLSVNLVGDLAFQPTLDGVVIDEPPLHGIAAGHLEGIPIMHGTTRDETRLWLRFSPGLSVLGPENIGLILPGLRSSLGVAKYDELVSAYGNAYPTASTSDVLLVMLTDVMFRIPHIRLAEAQYGHGDVFMYRFDVVSPLEDGFYGATHAAELPFVFFNLEPRPDTILGANPPRSVAVDMADAWTAFARRGDPNHGNLPRWPAYDPARRATMLFDVRSGSVDDPGAADRMAWDGIAFDAIDPKFQ